MTEDEHTLSIQTQTTLHMNTTGEVHKTLIKTKDTIAEQVDTEWQTDTIDTKVHSR